MSSSRRVLFAMGLVFSPLYALLMRLRAWLYRRNLLLRREQMAVPVISIGNLTMGGTGKTPLVIYVAGLLRGMGLHPAILSRGYGRRVAVSDRVLVVSSGAGGEEGPLVGADQAGDEPVLLARLLPDIPVLVAARRVLSGRYAVESMAADCLLLDDGFQHLALARDLDLVLFSARDLPCGARVFPGGPLRESWSALERADALVITGVDDGNRQKVELFAVFSAGGCRPPPAFSENIFRSACSMALPVKVWLWTRAGVSPSTVLPGSPSPGRSGRRCRRRISWSPVFVPSPITTLIRRRIGPN